jgi:hypothetical protein
VVLRLLGVIVPLSAYEVQQDFTYTPNDTVNIPPYSNLVPASLRRDHSDFIPHTFVMGEAFQTNFTAFDPYKIVAAYTREDTPGSVPRVLSKVPSFAYMNYDFKACDVTDITLDIRLPPHPSTTVTVRFFGAILPL